MAGSKVIRCEHKNEASNICGNIICVVTDTEIQIQKRKKRIKIKRTPNLEITIECDKCGGITKITEGI